MFYTLHVTDNAVLKSPSKNTNSGLFLQNCNKYVIGTYIVERPRLRPREVFSI